MINVIKFFFLESINLSILISIFHVAVMRMEANGEKFAIEINKIKENIEARKN